VSVCACRQCRFESQHILHAMTTAGVKSWIAMGEGRSGELGFLTTNARKEEMCLLLREAMKCSRISIHKRFVSISMGSEKGKQRLQDELTNYCVINDAPKSAFGKVAHTQTYTLRVASEPGLACACARVSRPRCFAVSQARKTFTGKLSGHQDDTAVALQIALLSSRIFYQALLHST